MSHLPHPNPSGSLPASRIRIGEIVVDIPLREVTRTDGSSTRLTVKSLEVLLLLAMHPGQVVSRDVLLKQVWAGTLPTNDVVTQAVVGLRRALGDDPGAPQYLETIPKSGYRLLAAVEWLADAAIAAQDRTATAEVPGTPGQGHRLFRRLGVLSGVLALAAIAWMAAHREGSSEATADAHAAESELRYVLLTSRPGPETQPALSPDGAMLAYAMPATTPESEPAIFLQAAQPASPRQLTFPPRGYSDHLPRWSPDGRQLMYVRINAKGGCQLQLSAASGGAARMVGRCDRMNGRYDWLPDGGGIVAGVKPESGARSAPLSILRLDSGRWQAMDYPVGPEDVDFDPRFSPDGRQLGFRRNLTHSDLWAMPAAGGTPSRLTQLRGSISGWDWMPDGRSLLFGFAGSSPQLYRHDLDSGHSRALGRFAGGSLDVSPRGSTLVFAIDDVRMSMFRYPLPLREGVPPEALFASTGRDALPSPSPDGRWVAFYSDRSREMRLWLGEPGRPEHLRMVEGVVPIARQPPRWSEDARRLLVIGEAVRTDPKATPRLYEIDVESGRATALPLADAPYSAQYLPGNRLLTIVDRGAGQLSLRISGSQMDARHVFDQLDDVGEARFDPGSGKVHFVRTSGPGLWQVGLDLRSPSLVDENQPTAYWMRRWAVHDGRPFLLRTSAPACLARWQWLGGHVPADGDCLDRERRGQPSFAPVVSHDGKWLYATMVAGQANSDIGLIDIHGLAALDSASH